MRKVIIYILVIIIIFTSIIPSVTYADDETSEYNAVTSIINDGEAKVNGTMQTVIDVPDGGDAIAAILALCSNAIAAVIKGLLSTCVNEENITEATNFTIGELVSGEYDIFNNDFLLTSNDSSSNTSIKEQVSGWYYAIRNLSIIISLLVLIYIGIRMAISTLSDDKAKYKKMMVAWLQSFVLIFFLHYIMIIAMAIQNALMEIILKVTVEGGYGQAEREIASTCWKAVIMSSGWNILWYSILYWVLTYYQVKFFLLYAKRMISTAFLMVIAPLITVTYSIDKVKDNRAQAFQTWLKEFCVNIFIQPVHLLIYLVFIVSASELATKVPLFTVSASELATKVSLFTVIFFISALSRAEKVIKGLFGMRGMKSIHSVGEKKK